MKFLLIGDIFGEPGRKCLEQKLKNIILEYDIDFVIANGENISHGSSIIKKHYDFLKKINVNVITSGNHIFRKPEVEKYIDNVPDLLRPINMNSYCPGKGTILVKHNNKKIRITNIMGKSFMDHVNNPFEIFDEVLKYDKSDIHIVDMHAETTAEKKAFAWNYDGKITCLVGTHTHVQTSDSRILPKGTAFISDLGMTGVYDSILGASPEEVIKKEKTGLRSIFKPAIGEAQFSGAILLVDDKTNKAVSLESIFIVPNIEKRKK